MRHCQKFSGGRSPPVTTREEWEYFTKEVDLITYDRSILRDMWLSATEGDKDLRLARLDHWPETEVVDNQRANLEAQETIWRDFYTGQRLHNNWPKPYLDNKNDTRFGKFDNCIQALIHTCALGDILV